MENVYQTVSQKKPKKEDVRTKGQVWTPSWVADALTAYLAPRLSGNILDPALGPGALLAACQRISNVPITAEAFEVDPEVISNELTLETFPSKLLSTLHINSFLDEDKSNKLFDAVIANPPFLRHHAISPDVKATCRNLATKTLGVSIDARAGLHVFFLIKALSKLKPAGRLAFILPADTFEGIFSVPLWRAIAEKYEISGVLTFSSDKAAFPGVDTNAVIVFIENSAPKEKMLWLRWEGSYPDELGPSLLQIFEGQSNINPGLIVLTVDLEEAISRGFTRDQELSKVEGIPLTDLARTMRGIASGANDYFVMTKEQIKQLGLPEELFVRTICRVRDAISDVISLDTLEELEGLGRPTYLLSLDANSRLSGTVKEYLEHGEALGVNKSSLVSKRKSWYFMEKRVPVPILFAYLGRRNNRFIPVTTPLQPLTGFLCVYPNRGVDPNKLIVALNHPSTISELKKVGKSYGDGAIKVEPGGLRKLVIPYEAIDFAGLEIPKIQVLGVS